MIFDMSLNDFLKEEGQVYYQDEEAKIIMYKVPDKGNVIFRNIYDKNGPEETIIFFQSYMMNARRITGTNDKTPNLRLLLE